MRTPSDGSFQRSLAPSIWVVLVLATGAAPARAAAGPDTTLLNAHGNPVKHFGDPDPDPDLARFGLDQTGAIKKFLG